MMHILKGFLASTMEVQRTRDEGILAEQWRIFADWLLVNDLHLAAEKIERSHWHSVEVRELARMIQDTAEDIASSNRSGHRHPCLLTDLWVSMSNQTEAGYLVRVMGVNHKISVRGAVKA